MQTISSTFIIQLIFLLCTINTNVFSLKCYQCNSHIDNLCNNVKNSRERPKECPPHLQASCKTVIQDAPFIYNHNATNKPAVRILRDCSAILAETAQCIDRVGTDKVKMRYCVCADDACNQSSRISSIQIKSVVISLILSILTYSFSLH
ncbi:hypothetical protein EWB00_004784 [Schistosoma japonicum]|uniref:Protein sleepless n=1 Tax=Schistosoma japonicum TaxID=6182 RepID=A0A4Z2D469_SCHJA|nr:hypothetical protein EWB00_004784 [Schistosoma japonicum]